MKTPLRGVGPPGDNEVFGLIMGDNHRYAMWDAAYVLGSLSSVDRREFEGHMAHCQACREAVAELSGVPALLSQLDRDEVTAITQSGDIPMATPEMSPELLPSLLAKVAWRRRRTRAITWVASSAAAAVLTVGVFVGIQGHSPSPTAPQPVRVVGDGAGGYQPAGVHGSALQSALGNGHQLEVRLPGSGVRAS